MNNSLALDSVSVAIGKRPIVEAMSASFDAGTFIALLGPNGAGKTTLLRAIAGLLPHQGVIRHGGQVLSSLSARERAKRIAYLPQGHQVHWPLPARDIVALGRYAHAVGDPAKLSVHDARIVGDAMAKADCLAFADQNVQTLSGGERARVMLARVLAAEAQVILADEPTAALDPKHQLVVMDVLRAQAASGALVVAVTHDIGLAARFADRILLLDQGALVCDGSPEAALSAEHMAKVYGVSMRRADIDGQSVLMPWSIL